MRTAMGGLTVTSSGLRFFGARLLSGTDGIVATVHADGLYAGLHPGEVAEVERTTRETIEAVVAAMLDGSRLDERTVRRLRRLGTRRAEQGVELSVVTTAFERATAASIRDLKQAARDWPDPDEALDAVVELTQALFSLVQEATGIVRDGYEDWVRGAAACRARVDVSVVEDLFEGALVDPQAVIERAGTLGYDVTGRLLVLVACPLDRAGANLREALLDYVPSGSGRPMVGLLRGTPLSHVPGVVPLGKRVDAAAVERSVDTWARGAGALVVSEVVDDISAVPAAYHAARDELAVARAVAPSPGVVDRTRDLNVARLLRAVDHEPAEAFVRTCVGPVLALPAATAEVLLATLSTVFSTDGSTEQAATQLSLSHSGLRSRLAKVSRLTARHHGRDRVELVLAVLLYRIHQPHLPPLGDPRWGA